MILLMIIFNYCQMVSINFLIGQDAYTQGYQSIMLLFHKLFDNKNPDSKFA